MQAELRQSYQREMNLAMQFYRTQQWADSFRRLERAHILGQHYAVAHTRTHWWFLKLAIKRRDIWEIVGQVVRIVGGFIGSLAGKVPVGNSGGADVSAFAVMPIPEDLREILIKDNKSWEAIRKAPNKGKA